jgi:hypothetical protein
LREYLGELRSKRRKRRRISVAVTLLVVMVAGSVIGALVQYGVAMTGDPKCGIEEHTHNGACYVDALVCGIEESEGHQHTENCYQTESQLACGMEEAEGTEESEGHIHNEECYVYEEILACGQEEYTGHTHTDACNETQLACGMEEHIHGDSCYIDTTADVEDSSAWDAQYRDIEWKDAWGEDLVTAAQLQIGYKESTNNYTVAEDGSHKGYTRYGQFAVNAGMAEADIYADWDAMFVNFCMYYAGIQTSGLFPGERDTAKWYDKFIQANETNQSFITSPEGYEPKAGDLIFFQKEDEETAFQMGIVSSYDSEKGKIKVIEGNIENEVKENEYETGFKYISAYLKISEVESAYKNLNESETSEPATSEPETSEPETLTDEATGQKETTETEGDSGTQEGTTETTENPGNQEGTTEIAGDSGNQEGNADTTENPETQEGTTETTENPGTQEGSTDTTENPGTQEGSTETAGDSGTQEGTTDTIENPGTQEGSTETTDYVECPTMAALDNLEENETGSAAEDFDRADIEEDSTANSGWSFDAYYVNQDDRYDVLKTADYNLKYQMEFHTSKNFRANEISIRIERRLFDDRDQKPVVPDQIAVPQVISEGDAEHPVESNNMPFNYRIITDEKGTEYLEFFNYKAIPAGSNVAWQILYKNLKIMKIIDEQEWELHPEIIIWDTDNEGNVIYDTEKTKRSTTPLKGKVDSSVKLINVTKKEYHESGKQYTPELYTASQVRAYIENISLENENEFFKKDENGKEILNGKYYYAVWEVTTKGAASQPWELQIKEKPGASGTVVGYKDNYNTAKGYDVKIDSQKALTDNIAIAKNEKTSWSSRFYVVTAYPTDKVTPGETKIKNEIEITAVPCDGKDQPEVKKAGSEFVYKEFDWTYPDDAIGVKKKSDDKEDYTGWLEVYKQVQDDYGNIGFTSLGEFRGYGLTHNTAGENIGQYKEGTSYKLITADDFMYVVNGDEYIMLEKEDYYYSAVSITQQEQGYDIWEDAIISTPEENGDTNEQGLKIYAQFGDDNPDQWQLVKEIPWDASGIMSYSFTPEELAKKPYRVKAEHVATNYRTTCEIKVNVRIRKDSPAMQEIIEGYEKGEISAISFEDLSGVIAQNKKADGLGWELTSVKKMEDITGNYSEPGLLEATKDLYEELKDASESDKNNFPMYRDNAYKKVTGLEAHAKSTKAVTSITNDVTNRHGQVVYSLTAQDGYDIFSEEAVTELKRKGVASPGRQNVVFYDLLPEGITFDPSYPVRAGRITDFDRKGNYTKQPGLWDSGQVEVTWETRDNHNGTSRTMVIFHIQYKGEDSAVFSNKSWLEGWGVSFRAYYDWEDTKLIEKGTNISAFMPDISDPHYGDSAYPLRGTDEEVAKDNGVIVPEDYKEVYGDFGANIDGNTANDNFPNVLYAENDESEDIAQSYSSAITKLVRADEDKYSSYRTSAVVEEHGYYTYDIKVTTGNSRLKDIIIYDHLENAASDRGNDDRDPNSGFADDNWKGTLQSVMTSGMNKLGAEPVVYYSADRNALMPDKGVLDSHGGRLENLKNDNGEPIWYTEEGFKNSHGGSLEDAKSVAVDIRKTAEGKDFILEAESSVSFRIKMQAPVIESDASGYAYNCPAYYSTADNGINNGIQYGDSVKVTRKKAASLEVMKEFGSDVPDSVKDTAFEFRLTDKRDEKNSKPFSYQIYKLYKKNAEGEWNKDPEAGQYATDGSGTLELKAGEKAVFEKVADVSNIEVKENTNIFWKSETEDTPVEEPDYVRTVTVTNTYRPVLYVEKKLEGVPEEIDIEEMNPEFTFRVQTEKEGTLTPLAGQEYYYVKEARTDGGIPRIDTVKGNNGVGTTDSEGKFTIHKGDIIAVFPGNTGTKYEVKEVSNGSSDDDWICREDTVTGKIPVRGASAVIRNYYRWRELYLTKRITHGTGWCNEPFTFQIQKVEKENGNEKVRLLTKEEIDRLELVMGIMLDGEFQEESGGMNDGDMNVGDRDDGDTNDGDMNVGDRDDGDRDVADMMRMTRGLGVTESTDKIPVDMTGRFTCYCADKTIRIRGLEAGETYRITEIVSEGSMYLPEQGTVDVSMSLYGDKKEVTITNDYQMRPLMISKKVVSSSGEVEDDAEFTMQIFVNGEPLKGHPYMIQESDVSGGSTMLPGGSLLSQGDRQDILLAEDGTSLLRQMKGIIGRPEEGGEFPEIPIPKTDEEGKIKLKNGQTAILIDAGKLGDEFRVVEEKTDGYRQIAPTGDGEGTFAGDAAEVVFVNAREDEGRNLYISKIYETQNMLYGDIAGVYVEELKEANREATDTNERGSVEVTLTINGDIYTGPEGDNKNVTVVNQLTGRSYEKQWNGETFTLDPWSIVIIPIEDDGEIVYTLSESKDDQHQIIEYQGSWLEISQKEPKNDRPAEGTIIENPIATITNEVKSVGVSSLVTKQMTEDSSEVPEGAELVWRVEVFNGVTWQPAENIPYITLEGDWSKDTLAEASAIPTCDRILKTGPDGRIVLTKNWSEDGTKRWPAVYFAETYVGVNKYDSPDKDDYRVVEVMEESDEAWGMLKEYTTSKKGFGNNHDDGLDLTGFSAGGFMNSNENAPIEIAKEMDEDSDDTFTMILKQVLSLSSNVDYGNIREEDIIASEGRAGISYTVYDTATGEAIAERETGKNGEIQLKAGQFVRLNLSNTLWTVSEEIGHTYKLKSLTPESATKLKKLNDNLMLINCEPTYTVTYRDGLDGNEILEEFEGLRKGSLTPKLDDKLERPGYKFTGWSPEWQERVTESVTYTAKWEAKERYTIIYKDGADQEFFGDETYYRYEGELTPAYSNGEPKRNGYIFAGWSPKLDEYVTQDRTYIAQWKKLCTVKYTDGVKNETVFDDQVYEDCVEGSPTPPFKVDEVKKDPERPGYIFEGWAPTVQPIVDAEDENGEIVYTATWRKN